MLGVYREISILKETKDCEYTPELVDLIVKEEPG